MSEVSTTGAPVESQVEVVDVSAAPEAEATPQAEPKQDFLAPKFAALTRKEKQVRAYEAQLKAREAEIARKFAEYEEKSKAAQSSNSSLEAEFKSNPLKALEKYGITFDQLMEMQLNEQNPTPQMMIERMKKELEEKYTTEIEGVKMTLKQKEEAEAKQRYEAAISGYQTELHSFVEQNADKYELLAANNGTQLMFETAQAFYEQTGKVPSNEELAQAVEEHLEEQINQIAKLKKVQSKFGSLSAPKTEATQTKTAQTLSNTLAAEVPKSGNKLLSDEESKKNAAKLLRWND